VHDYGLVHHERASSLIIAPDAFGLRVGGRAAEHAPEHLERGVDPALLVDRGRSVALDAWNEKDHEDAHPAAPQNLLPASRLLLPSSLRHPTINIDRSAGCGNGR